VAKAAAASIVLGLIIATATAPAATAGGLSSLSTTASHTGASTHAGSASKTHADGAAVTAPAATAAGLSTPTSLAGAFKEHAGPKKAGKFESVKGDGSGGIDWQKYVECWTPTDQGYLPPGQLWLIGGYEPGTEDEPGTEVEYINIENVRINDPRYRFEKLTSE